MLSLVLFATCGTSVFAQTPLPDGAAFRQAIQDCLTESSSGLCTAYGSNGYGTMPNWNTSNVTNMSCAFSAYLNCNINGVTYLGQTFNGDISAWDTSAVTDMSDMFRRNTAFNQDITSWNTANVTSMIYMFQGASAFNQDIRRWDVSSVGFGGFYVMFGNATQFYNTFRAPNTPDAAFFSTYADAPTIGTATPGNGYVDVAFTAPANTGGAAITNYEYSSDGGTNWTPFNPATTVSPVTITGLTNGTRYSIALRAVNSVGSGTASLTTTVTPVTTSDAPTALVATPGNGQVSIAFTDPASTGGVAITDYEYELDGSGSWVSANTTSSPVVITGLTNGTSYSVKLRAVNSVGNGSASAAVSFDTSSSSTPATAFSEHEADIRLTIVNDATRSLQSVVGANRLMTQKARQRFVESNQESLPGQAMLFINNNVPLDVNGTADISGTSLGTKGTFFGQTGNAEGTQRRLVFGDFDVQHDGNTGSSTATLTGRMAWEQMTSSDTMLGYFIGGELARSNIEGAFAGDQNRIGVTVGGYGVHSLSDNLFVDGFVTLGAGRNNLTMANDVLALDSDYTTRTATVGGTLSGRIEQKDFDIWPELSFVYGRTWIGDVGFTGRAYGLVDDTLSLNAGSVTLANVMFRPEFRIPLDGLQASKSLSLLTFAPRMICEQVKATTKTKNCGSGAEFGIATHSADGLSNVNAKILADRLGNSTKSGLQLNLEHRF